MTKKQSTVDPVCGMRVDPPTASFTLEYEGTRYAFCCDCCMNAFKADPKRHATKATASKCGCVQIRATVSQQH